MYESVKALEIKISVLFNPLQPTFRKLCRKKSNVYMRALQDPNYSKMLKKVADVSSSRDRMVTLGFYGKLIKEKNSIRI